MQAPRSACASLPASSLRRRPDKPRLSRRQTQILCLVAQGMTDKQVARELGLSPRTVEMHVALALRALGCSNRAEAVHRAGQEGLLVETS